MKFKSRNLIQKCTYKIRINVLPIVEAKYDDVTFYVLLSSLAEEFVLLSRLFFPAPQ